MLQQFTQDDIDQFYTDFPNNYKEYEKSNQDAVDTLYAAIDFSKFKEQMIKFKGGVQDLKPEDQKKMDDDFKVTGLNHDAICAEPLDDPAFKWQKVISLDKPEYKGEVWARPRGDKTTGVSLLRMNLVFKNVKKEWHLDVLKDGPPVKNMKERRVVEEVSENDKVIYIKMNMGLMSDRDHYVSKKISENDDGSTSLLLESLQGDKYPITPGAVRIEMYKSQKLRQEGEDLHIQDVSSFDFKGYFPMRLMSMMMGSMMPKVIGEINGQFDDYRNGKK